MSARQVTIELPASTFERIKKRAEDSNRSLPDEIVQVVVGAVPSPEDLPDDVAPRLDALNFLSDNDLWKIARCSFSPASSTLLADLNSRFERGALTTDEARQREALLSEYDRQVLVRAQAAVLLKRRGFDVAALSKP